MRTRDLARTSGALFCAVLTSHHVRSHPTGTASPSRATAALHERQNVQATSSMNWWPYPSYSAWGQTTYATGTTPIAVPTSATPLVSAPAEVITTAITSYSDDSITMPTTLLSQSSPSSSSLMTSTSLSASLIRVPALPPASSQSSVARAREHMAQKGSTVFNIVYLAPLFAVLGAIAGGVLTWLLYRCLPTHREHQAELVPGPVYNPPTVFRRQLQAELVPGPVYNPPTAFRRQLRPASLVPPEVDRPVSTPSTEGLVAEQSVEGSKKGSWLGRAFSSRTQTSAVPSKTPGGGEDDPFLDHSTPTNARSASSQRPTRTSDGSRSRQGTSPDLYGALSDVDDSTPYETLRHKSIRRGILERLRSSTLRRSKGSYKLTRTNDNTDAGSESDTATPVQRPRGHRRTGTDTSGASSSDQDREGTSSRPGTISQNGSRLASPSGFRIVVEDPESGALFDADEVYSPEASPTPRPTVKRQKSDRFTPVPVRRSTEEKRHSPFVSPSKAGVSSPPIAQGANGMSRIDSSILPVSPPMVTSPPLESQLFFGATSPSLVLLRSAPAVSVKTVVNAMEKGASDDGKNRNKLRTQREPPLLPFPSTASTSPYRGRLKKSTTRAPQPRPAAERADSGTSSCSSDSAYSQATTATSGKAGRGTAAERYIARKTALSKVDEILSRSWSERQLAGETRSGSPNKFGAVLPVLPALPGEEECVDGEEREASWGMGIEQRLAAFMK